ncbi:MAG: insulinase family protein, partial [Thermodesulfobacteriota bacterium]|nr:insulinase family protein [Thermodesulfobacteriota bacterium]
VRFVLSPDPEMAKRDAEREAAELAAIGDRLSASEKEKIRIDSKALETRQATVEDVAVLPTLAREDIPPDISRVRPVDVDMDVDADCYVRSTSGIFYHVSAAGIGHLDQDLVPYLPFFCHALTKMGTSQRDYVAMARRIDRYTGGIGFNVQARTHFDGNGACLPMIHLGGKCLDRNQAVLFDIVGELLGEGDFSDLTRLKTLLRESRAAMEAMVVQNGHHLAISLASRTFSPTTALNETFSGIHQLRIIKKLSENLGENDLTDLAEKLSRIREKVFQAGNMKTALIGEEAAVSSASRVLNELMSRLNPGNGNHGFDAPGIAPPPELPREGWHTATAVSFVAQTFKTVRMGHDDAPVLAVIAKMLRSLYLHREIREKGGAYGGFAAYNPESGIFAMASYRDPHIVATLGAFQGANDYIRSGDFTDEDIKEAVLQVCADIDKPDPPGPAARKAFFRSLVALTDARRLKFKQAVLYLSRQQVIAAADRYFTLSSGNRAVAVISGEDRLKEANPLLGDQPLSLFKI